MHSKTETCCSEPLASRDGFLVCLQCGKVSRPHLDTRHTSYTQCFGYIKSGYSRKNRFEKKLIASLRWLAHYNIDTELVKHLKKLKIDKVIIIDICCRSTTIDVSEGTLIQLSTILH